MTPTMRAWSICHVYHEGYTEFFVGWCERKFHYQNADAEDLVSELWIDLWNAVRRDRIRALIGVTLEDCLLDEHRKPTFNLLFKRLIGKFKDECERNARRPRLGGMYEEASAILEFECDSVFDRIRATEKSVELRNAIKTLPKFERMLTRLELEGDLSIADIARACDVKRSTVTASLCRCRQKLGKKVQAD